MCGRYQFSCESQDLRYIMQNAQRQADGVFPPEFHGAGEILPTDTAPVLIACGGKIRAEFQHWGIRNQYGKRMVNARAETVTEKPMFRRSIAAQRCVVPASAYYEWDKAGHQYRFSLPGRPLYLAGIYDYVDGLPCFVLLTTASNASVKDIHDRMPLLLPRDQIRPWLTDAGAALLLLASTPPLLERSCTDGQLRLGDPALRQ